MARPGELGPRLAASGSTEDLSEYTDADESISAPTEFLAEFLSAVMLKDYETALKYCKLILQYEPNNATAKEFYPLIVEKLEMIEQDVDSESESSETESSSSTSSSSSGSGDGDEHKPTDSDGTTASYSSLEDDEADQENNAVRFTQRFSSTDFTNGNTSEVFLPERRTLGAKQRLAEAIQRKLEDNRKAVRLPLRERLDALSSAMARVSLGPQWGEKSPDSDDQVDFPYNASATTAHVSSEPQWDEKSPESEASLDFPFTPVIKNSQPRGFGGAQWDEKSPESEVSVGFPFSSDSESPTDPHSQLTIQEAHFHR